MTTKDPLFTTWQITEKFSEVYDRMPIRWIQAFLYLAMHKDRDDLTQDQIAVALGTPTPVVSKFIKKMSDRPGCLGLIHSEVDAMNESRRSLTFTAKGRKLLNDLQIILTRG